MDDSRGRAKTPLRSSRGNAPDPNAVPIGLETWRTRVGDSEYALFRFPLGKAERWSCLTSRERTVASEILHGLSNAEIAGKLGVAPRTVANQIASIFRKLGVGSRAELSSLFVRSLQKKR